MSQTCHICSGLTTNRPAYSIDLPNCGMFQYTFLKLSRTNVTKIRPVTAAIFHTSKHTWLRREGWWHI